MPRHRAIIFLVIMTFVISFLACSNNPASTPELQKTEISQPAKEDPVQPKSEEKDITPSQNQPQQGHQPDPPPPITGYLKVHFLDVGQADSILVQLPNGENMLIDAGNNSDGSFVVSYLKGAGIKDIDYLVGTHPHEDHIGGLDTVINGFNIGKVYMPNVTATTRTFEDVLKAVRAKGLKITTAKANLEIVRGNGFSAVFVVPHLSTYDKLNNYSSVVKITFGEVSFLLTGDAEEQSESEMLLSSVVSPKADVLKVGHHGSKSSTSAPFLQAVNPKYAVISVGAGNDYGHPHQETLDKLKGVEVYRTDLNGTIVFTTDGKAINVLLCRVN